MSSSKVNTFAELDLITFYSNISAGALVVILGIIGNILNIIVFLSLKTFRKHPCAFCLLVLSISDGSMLISSTVPVILADIVKNSIGINPTIGCKISMTFGQTFGLISHSVICLAAIDQSLSTSMHKNYKGMTRQLIGRIILIIIFVCMLHGIPFFIYHEVQTLPGTNATICRITQNGEIFSNYLIYVGFPIVDGILPIVIMSVFGLIALRNVRTMTKRRVHIIRLRSEQQLTAMVLIKILTIFLIVVPFLIAYIFRYRALFQSDDPAAQRKYLFLTRICTFLLFLNYADSFYIFLACSARFRRQTKFVLFDVYFKKWKAKKRKANQIQPASESFVLSITNSCPQ